MCKNTELKHQKKFIYVLLFIHLFITNKTEQYILFFSQESTFKEEWL